MIGNSNINKIGSREDFDHFREPGSAVDDSSRCIHVFKGHYQKMEEFRKAKS